MELHDEQTLIKWTLFPEEIDFLKSKARGVENLLRYAIQFGWLKLNGRFIKLYQTLPLAIVNYLSKQLEGELIHFPIVEGSSNTEVRIKKQVADFLGFKDFNTTYCHDKIGIWLEQNPDHIGNKKDFARKIEEFLLKEKIILPASSQLMRSVFSIYASRQKAIFETIANHLSNKQKNFIDSFGGKQNKQAATLFHELLKPMGEANAKNILSRIALFEELQKLKLNELPLESINPDYRQKLAKLTQYYDSSSLQKIKPAAKRYTMIVCYLSEISKVMLDQIIDANDKFLSEIERRINRDFEEEYKYIRTCAQASHKLALQTLEMLLNHKQRTVVTIDQFCSEIGNDKLSKIITDWPSVKNELFCRHMQFLKK